MGEVTIRESWKGFQMHRLLCLSRGRTFYPRIMEAVPKPPNLVTISWKNLLPENHGRNSKNTESCDYLVGEVTIRESWKGFQNHRFLCLSCGRTNRES
ncbi:hypothetical protein NPIL_518341 [Nephila pilipes]|uniref:Uncharacterized protein n=1 Tax=Nephila pilipes TaxID=299642 RepID=A0A8X6TT03_NEPPI|nr:hypothetical protein NPIL_518341 [Nephila pilipes]